MHTISLSKAREIADAAFAEAASRNVNNISVVITDHGGDIRLAMRADSQGAFGVDTARAKAQSALGFHMSTQKLNQFFKDVPSSTIGINAATGGRFIPIAGAILVCNEQDEIIGAASISGGAPDIDHDIITAAVKAVGLNTRQ